MRDLFFSKTGDRCRSSCEDTRRGIRLEKHALQKLSEHLGEHVFPVHGYIRHPRFPFLCASPDGVTQSGAIVEVKAPRSRRAFCIDHHEAQMRFDMAITGAERAIYCQIVEDDIFIEILERDDELFLKSLPKLYMFWEALTLLTE